MIRILIIPIFFIVSFIAFAQERYINSAFDDISVDTYTYATKNGEPLKLDIYIPQNDTASKRATFIYVHGGAFMGGSRDEASIRDFCNYMAGYGYVVASISYRLTRKNKETGFGCDCPAADKQNTFIWALQDVQDATFFLIQNREQFGVDPQKIILSGSSAGAETVLNTAYLPPMCYGLDSGPVSYAGVISMAGAIPDTVVIYNESAVPSMLFHGTDDELVPYATAPHRYCKKGDPGYLILNGAYTIAQKLEKLGTPYWLHTTCGGGHEIAGTPMQKYRDEIVEFCYHFIIKGEKQSKRTIIEGQQKGGKYPEFDFCRNK